jgi:hypothetical protein
MENHIEFLPEKYQPREIKQNGIIVNIFGVVVFIVLGSLFGFIYYQIWGTFGLQLGYVPLIRRITNALVFLSIVAAFSLAHEMIHGMYWSKYTEVKISVIINLIFRGCYCKEPIIIKKFIMGLIMPTIILGVIPFIIGMVIGNILLFGFGILFIVVGSDDFLIMYLLRKEDKKNWVKDMDNTIGIIVYSPNHCRFH